MISLPFSRPVDFNQLCLMVAQIISECSVHVGAAVKKYSGGGGGGHVGIEPRPPDYYTGVIPLWVTETERWLLLELHTLAVCKLLAQTVCIYLYIWKINQIYQ